MSDNVTLKDLQNLLAEVARVQKKTEAVQQETQAMQKKNEATQQKTVAVIQDLTQEGKKTEAAIKETQATQQKTEAAFREQGERMSQRDKRADKRILGADKSVSIHAEKMGLYVIRATGGSASIVNGEGFGPRAF